MIVNEIFTSIQGESTWQGFPFTFVRLTGCNLRCSYCDTTYAYEEGREMSREAILSEVGKRGVDRVLITGGEPLLQEGTPGLIGALDKKGFHTFLETNGSWSLKEVPMACVKIVDVKTPGSGEVGSFFHENLPTLTGRDQIKFVVTDRVDFDFAREEMEGRLSSFEGTFLMSPEQGGMSPEELARWILEEKVDCMLNLQLHRLIFKNSDRGV